jgi:hypothetical protein
MTALLVVAGIVVAYGFFHLGHGTANMRHHRARGLAPSMYWCAGMRGPWVSIRLPGGFRIGHKL